MVSCAIQINTAFKKCGSERNAKACIELLLENSKCLKCLCKLIPMICVAEESETQQEQKQILNLNKAINTMAICGPTEIYKCQSLVRLSVKKCQNKYQCVLDDLNESQCNICVCSIAPQICTKDTKK